jgi:hypothetical protein
MSQKLLKELENYRAEGRIIFAILTAKSSAVNSLANASRDYTQRKEIVSEPGKK